MRQTSGAWAVGLIGLLAVAVADTSVWAQSLTTYRDPVPPVVVFRSTDPVIVAPRVALQSPVVVDPSVATPASPTIVAPPVTVQRPVVAGQLSTEAVTVYSPYLPPAIATPPPSTTVFSPVGAAAYGPPSVTTVYSPVEATPVPVPVTSYQPVPVTSYQPVTVTSYHPVPVTAYRPVTTFAVPPPAVVAAPVPVGRAVVVRPKVYVQGQPVRNFFRAITP